MTSFNLFVLKCVYKNLGNCAEKFEVINCELFNLRTVFRKYAEEKLGLSFISCYKKLCKDGACSVLDRDKLVSNQAHVPK